MHRSNAKYVHIPRILAIANELSIVSYSLLVAHKTYHHCYCKQLISLTLTLSLFIYTSLLRTYGILSQNLLDFFTLTACKKQKVSSGIYCNCIEFHSFSSSLLVSVHACLFFTLALKSQSRS